MSEGVSERGEVLQVESLVPGGRALSTLSDGRKAFIDGAFPGDEIAIREYDEKKSYVEVHDFELLKPSLLRVNPSCAVSAECGGCDWISLSEEAQASSKLSLVAQALKRTGGIDLSEEGIAASFHPCPLPFEYRSRVRLRIAQGRVGFFRKASHDLVDVEACVVMTPLLKRCVSLFRKCVASHPGDFSKVGSVELRAIGSGTSPHRTTCSALLKPEKGRNKRRGSPAKELTRLRRAVKELSEQLDVRFAVEDGRAQSFEPCPGVKAYAPVGSFTQVNETVNRLLIERVLSAARRASARSFLDLYCGNGNFSLPLAADGMSGVGVEINRPAILAARRAATEQSFDVEFQLSSSELYLSELPRSSRRFDVVLVDPPRAGAKELLVGLCALRAPLLLMVSCDPVTLARDLKFLLSEGYRIKSLDVFDMFPQTHHAESLVVLTYP